MADTYAATFIIFIIQLRVKNVTARVQFVVSEFHAWPVVRTGFFFNLSFELRLFLSLMRTAKLRYHMC